MTEASIDDTERNACPRCGGPVELRGKSRTPYCRNCHQFIRDGQLGECRSRQLGIVHHEHQSAELDAPAWDTARLIAHLAEMHGLTVQPRDVQALAAIHAAEHPVQAGLSHR